MTSGNPNRGPTVQVVRNPSGDVIAVAVTRLEHYWEFPNGGEYPDGTAIPEGGVLPTWKPKLEGAVHLIWPRIRLYLSPAYQKSQAANLAELAALPAEASEAYFEEFLQRLGIHKEPWDLSDLPPAGEENVKIRNTPGWISMESWQELWETVTTATPEEAARL